MVSKRKKSRINAAPGAACKAGESQKRDHTEILRADLGPISREYAILGVVDMAPNRRSGESGSIIAVLMSSILH